MNTSMAKLSSQRNAPLARPASRNHSKGWQTTPPVHHQSKFGSGRSEAAQFFISAGKLGRFRMTVGIKHHYETLASRIMPHASRVHCSADPCQIQSPWTTCSPDFEQRWKFSSAACRRGRSGSRFGNNNGPKDRRDPRFQRIGKFNQVTVAKRAKAGGAPEAIAFIGGAAKHFAVGGMVSGRRGGNGTRRKCRHFRPWKPSPGGWGSTHFNQPCTSRRRARFASGCSGTGSAGLWLCLGRVRAAAWSQNGNNSDHYQ